MVNTSATALVSTMGAFSLLLNDLADSVLIWQVNRRFFGQVELLGLAFWGAVNVGLWASVRQMVRVMRPFCLAN
jgi:hypothetical protein